MRSYFRHGLPMIAIVALTLIFCASVSAQPRGGGGAILAEDEPAESAGVAVGVGVGSTSPRPVFGGEPKQTSAGRKKSSASARTRTRTATAAKTTAAPKQSTRPYDGFVIGDKYTFLNFEVVSAVKPYHTRAAKASGAKGLVQVEVLISEQGNVLTAKARTGNKELHPEAERAALASKFNKPSVYGKPARAMGFLVYRFGPADD